MKKWVRFCTMHLVLSVGVRRLYRQDPRESSTKPVHNRMITTHNLFYGW